MDKKVLVIDDEPSIREILRRWLEIEGYETRCASDGVEGLRLLNQFTPDLIVADMKMPRMDGFEFTRLARKIYKRPIMILSGFNSSAHSLRVLAEGANDYMAKPVQMQDFLAKAAALLGRSDGDDAGAGGGGPVQLAAGIHSQLAYCARLLRRNPVVLLALTYVLYYLTFAPR